MSLALPDHWLWDFWFAQDEPDVHAFFLHAPRALGDPELRHRNARIGHAVSRDLHEWRLLPEALATGPPGVRRPGRLDRQHDPARRALAPVLHRAVQPRRRGHATHRGGHLRGPDRVVLSDPMPLTIHRDGSLSVQVPVAG